MKFEETEVRGFEPAIVGIRLPMSKDYKDAKSKSDSKWVYDPEKETSFFLIGDDDMRICKNLINADEKIGVCQPNSKFLQMIEVWVCIEAPLTYWKEADTYRHAVKNSTSTMHRIQKYEITEACFEPKPNGKISDLIDIQKLEKLRKRYNETLDKNIWYDLIYGLPDSWLQTRMCHFNYATLRNMYTWRKNHKQNCWSGKDNLSMQNMKAWIESLPYAKEFLCE